MSHTQTTLFLYPKGEPSIRVLIRYVPDLDNTEVQGYWDTETNRVAVSWRLYQEFAKLESQASQKKFFASLMKVKTAQLPFRD